MADRELEALRTENRDLKQRLRKLEKELKKYKTKTKTMESAWKETEYYLSELTKDLTLEDSLKLTMDIATFTSYLDRIKKNPVSNKVWEKINEESEKEG